MRTCVIASGHFDCLHVGHLHYLRAARQLGDHLTVIVNNDTQTTLKKGRPFMPAAERVEIIRALRFVNSGLWSIDEDCSVAKTLACVHDMLSPTKLVFANGGDVTLENCREREVCERLGIQMVFGVGGTEKVQSSSALLARARTF